MRPAAPPRAARRHSLRATLALVAAVCVMAVAAPAGARPGQVGSPTPTSVAAADVPGLPPGMAVTGAVVREPGEPDRNLTAGQATAFMQSWFADSIFSGAPSLTPVGEFEYATLDVTATYGGEQTEFETFFTCKGETAWVGMPQQQIAPGAFVPAERWVEAGFGTRVIAAYKGLIAPIVDTSGTPPTAPPGSDVSCPFDTDPQFTVAPLVPGETTTSVAPTTTVAPDDDSSGSSSFALWAVVAAAVVAAGVVGTLLGRRGRKA